MTIVLLVLGAWMLLGTLAVSLAAMAKHGDRVLATSISMAAAARADERPDFVATVLERHDAPRSAPQPIRLRADH